MQTEYDNLSDIDYIYGTKAIALRFNNEEGKNIMENVNDTTPVATPEQQALTPEQMAKLMEEMANQPITSDEADPTDAERVIH